MLRLAVRTLELRDRRPALHAAQSLLDHLRARNAAADLAHAHAVPLTRAVAAAPIALAAHLEVATAVLHHQCLEAQK